MVITQDRIDHPSQPMDVVPTVHLRECISGIEEEEDVV